MATLSCVRIFANDLVVLSAFYRQLFGFQAIAAIRSPIFVGRDTGGTCIGLNARDACALLNFAAYAEPASVKFLLNIDVDSAAEVDRLTPRAVAAGATLVKPPCQTYYKWYHAVLLDPEQNVFRINHVLSS